VTDPDGGVEDSLRDRARVAAAYDEVAEAYANVGDPESPPDVVARFLAALDRDAAVFDAGCGGGDAVLHAAVDADGPPPVGLDFSGAQLDMAREAVPAAALVRGDMTALPFASDAFDAVAALYSLIHVPLDDHRTVLDEFARVLRPGGQLLLTEGHERWEGSNPDWLDSGTEMRWAIAGAAATREELRGSGFAVDVVELVVDSATEDGTKPFFLATLNEE